MVTSNAKEPVVLLQSHSPICQMEALVEDNGDCVYFYLYGEKQQAQFMQSCWVCNRTAAPEKIDENAMQAGSAPKMPRGNCDHPAGMAVPQQLEIIWFEEGDAAALLAAGQLLAVIPGWAEPGAFPGYSRHCTAENMLAWPLVEEAEQNLMKRVIAGKDWDAYIRGDFWSHFQPTYLKALEGFFGAHERYFGIDGGKFPPKALVTGNKDSLHYAVTLGVSLFPMPKTDQYDDADAPARRIELAFAWKEGSPLGDEMAMFTYLSFISSIPWQNLTFLGTGHTIRCDSISGFTDVLLLSSSEQGISLPDFRADKVEILWVVPITGDECTLARSSGSQALLERVSTTTKDLCVFTGTPKFSL